MRLEELIKRVPEATEGLVEAARQRYNSVIRTILREEMALRLTPPAGADGSEWVGREAVNIPVRVVTGVPDDADREIRLDDIDTLAILLGQHRSTLEALCRSTKSTWELISAMRRLDPPVEAPLEAVQVCQEWSESLLKRLAKADPVKTILSFKDDILGRYIYRLPPSNSLNFGSSPDPFKGEVELYWGVIGLVCELLNATAEELTVVVLAHELAHAYTHLGADTDGLRWGSIEFSKSDVALKEGLAQYYTWRTCERLKDRLPGALAAFTEMLPRQPEVYRTQQKWIEAKSTPEHVRAAMLETRRLGVGAAAAFMQSLTEARKRLADGRGGRAASAK
jgi:hypothetical protein